MRNPAAAPSTQTSQDSRLHTDAPLPPGNRMSDWAVIVVTPLTSVTVARHEPPGSCLLCAKTRFPDWPGASVTTCCSRNGPAVIPPGPSDRRAWPLRSMASSPVSCTRATMTG